MSLPVHVSLAHARRFGWPLPDLWHSDSLTADDLRAYWLFRRGFMDLKPHVDPEADYAHFAAWVHGSDFVWMPRDRQGRIVATMAAKVEHRTHEGRACVVMFPDYGFVLPEARGSMGIGGASVVALGLGVLRWPGKPLYCSGRGYISIYMALCRALARAWIREDAGMDPWERSLWRSLAEETEGYDRATQLVNMPTIPRNPRTHPPRDPRMLARYRDYLAHNPRWAEGHACMLLARVGPEDVAHLARWLARRAAG